VVLQESSGICGSSPGSSLVGSGASSTSGGCSISVPHAPQRAATSDIVAAHTVSEFEPLHSHPPSDDYIAHIRFFEVSSGLHTSAQAHT
jgi:hypothetical protein